MLDKDSFEKNKIQGVFVLEAIRLHVNRMMAKFLKPNHSQQHQDSFSQCDEQLCQPIVVQQFCTEVNNEVIENFLSISKLSDSINHFQQVQQLSSQNVIQNIVQEYIDQIVYLIAEMNLQNIFVASQKAKAEILQCKQNETIETNQQNKNQLQFDFNICTNISQKYAENSNRDKKSIISQIQQQQFLKDNISVRKLKSSSKVSNKNSASIQLSICKQAEFSNENKVIKQKNQQTSRTSTFRRTKKKKNSTHLHNSGSMENSNFQLKKRDKNESQYEQFLDQNLVQYFYSRNPVKRKHQSKPKASAQSLVQKRKQRKPQTVPSLKTQMLTTYQRTHDVTNFNRCDLISLNQSKKLRTSQSRNKNAYGFQQRHSQFKGEIMTLLQKRITATEKQVMNRVPALMKMGVKFKKTHKIR